MEPRRKSSFVVYETILNDASEMTSERFADKFQALSSFCKYADKQAKGHVNQFEIPSIKSIDGKSDISVFHFLDNHDHSDNELTDKSKIKMTKSEIFNQFLYEGLQEKYRLNRIARHLHEYGIVEENKVVLNEPESGEREKLINYINDLIADFEFEGPRYYKKNKIAYGPRNDGMYIVLKSAIIALNELNPEFLHAARERVRHEYNLIRLYRSGWRSLTDSKYASFAHFFGAGKHQPGGLVNDACQKSETLLNKLCDLRKAELHRNGNRL